MKRWVKCSEAMRLLKMSRNSVENAGFETKTVGRGLRYLIDIPEEFESLYVDKEEEDFEITQNTDLDEAKLENIRTRTKWLKERLLENKQELWIEWNEKAFEAFTESFAKWKNRLVMLHLGAEQLQELYTGLDEALKSLGDKLDIIEKEIEQEDKEEGDE